MMLRTRNSFCVFSIGLCILIIFQVTDAQNDVKEDILELLNEIKNEKHKSLQQLREELLWQHPISNNILGTELNPKQSKRQNSQHIIWSKMGKLRTGASTSSLRQTGKRTAWDTQPEQFENTFYKYPNGEPSHIKPAKRVDSQQRLWTLLGDADNDRVDSLATTGKRTSMFKRQNAHQIIWSKLGSVLQNNDRIGALAATGKRTPTGTNVKGQHMFFNTVSDLTDRLYRDPNVWTSLKAILTQDSTLPGQPSKLDESDYVDEILRQETNEF